ncbi:MAG TPA: FAD-binding oxidoreductase [Bryobacteraceae bacterium]|nr:FAD-binding oxidoreductase [Bryobacteraceae bacterium]
MRLDPDSPYLADASNYRGHADELLIPEDEAGVVDIMRRAASQGIPVTISGGGSGLTGGRVPDGGWLISLEKLNSIDVHEGYAICGAGASLTSIQAAAAPSKQFYPPDPTEYSAAIGGTVATNASGSRSFRYRDTRRHIRALRVVLASGEVLAMRRGEKPPFPIPPLPAPDVRKNTAGYYMREGMDYMDLFIGSEGTLGIVTQVEVALLPLPNQLFTGVVFFESDDAALDAVDAWRPIPGLRMLEYIDAGSLDLVRTRYSGIPTAARAAVLTEQEVAAGEDAEEAWERRLRSSSALIEGSWFAASAADRERFRQFRHALPEVVNDLARQRGLTTVGTDFSVPVAKNREMLRFYREMIDREFTGKCAIFGHIGDAHVHANFLSADNEQWQAATRLITTFAKKSVELGGTVSAEHGLGKRKRDLLKLQFSDEQIETMKAIKRRLDPQWLLGRGTLFSYTGS